MDTSDIIALGAVVLTGIGIYVANRSRLDSKRSADASEKSATAAGESAGAAAESNRIAQEALDHEKSVVSESRRIRVSCAFGYGFYHYESELRMSPSGMPDGYEREGFGVIVDVTNVGREFVLTDACLLMSVVGNESQCKPEIRLLPCMPNEVSFGNEASAQLFFCVPPKACGYLDCKELSFKIILVDEMGKETSRDLSRLDSSVINRGYQIYTERLIATNRKAVPFVESDTQRYTITPVKSGLNRIAFN